MPRSQIGVIVLLSAVIFTMAGCSHVGEDWKAAQSADSTQAYQDFLRQHPDSEYGVAAQERIRQLAEDRDWQQAAKADTLDAYQQFVAVHADGKWAQEARVRIENFQLSAGGQAPPAVPGSEQATAGTTASAETAAPQPSARSKTAAPSSPTEKSASRHYAQLGAYRSKAAAESAWQRLRGRFPAQLKSLQPHYAANAKNAVRLRVSLSSAQRVRDLCSELKKQSQACIPLD